ncbi:MAG TPA: hypothetical protein VGP88_03085 [Thermoplasmata archaeon]|jgi:hypothetical protein|nr:hypothetical protein [Thermoplasmata archaeon]
MTSWRTWAGLGVVAIVALLLGSSSAGAVTPAATYSVSISQIGLPAGTTWSAVFNGVTNSGTGSSIAFTGISAGSYCWSVTNPVTGTPTTTRYVPYAASGCITVPNQLSISDVYTTQYSVNFGVVPVSSGNAYPGTNWYSAGSTIAIQSAATYGFAFHSWTATPIAKFTLASSTQAATELTILGAGSVTAHFTATKVPVSFTEVGLPTGTSWSVVFGGTSYLGSTATLAAGSHSEAGYSWTVSPVAHSGGIQYAPSPASGSMSTPYQTSQTIAFVEQFSVTFATNPSSSGTTAPGVGSAYYTNGTNMPITAFDSGTWQFSGWSSANPAKVGINSKSTEGTNATVMGSTTVTAKFVTGTACTTCSLTFYEIGLPTGTGWGVSFNGTLYTSSASSIAVTGQKQGGYWGVETPLGAGQYGVQYYASGTATSGYWYLGETNSITFSFVKEYYLTVAQNPSYTGGGGPTISSQWYPAGTQLAIAAIGSTTYKFGSWTSSNHNLSIASPTKGSTFVTVNGVATLTLNQVVATGTAHFEEMGLPSGTTWGLTFNGQQYWSSKAWINVTGTPYGTYSWSPETGLNGGRGIEWNTLSYFGQVIAPTEGYAVALYAEAFQLTVQAGGTVGGSTNPSGTAYFWSGTVLPLMAVNGTSVSFTSWSKTVTSGTITIATTKATTTVTIAGTGTITGNFA